MLGFLKKYYPIVAATIFQLKVVSVFGTAIIGGQDNATSYPYAALVSPLGVTTPLSGPALPIGTGRIYSVGINTSGWAIIGGRDNGNTTPYIALVSPNGVTTALTGIALPTGNGSIQSVAINGSGSAIIGGGDNSIPYAALVSPTGVTTALSGPALPIGTGSIQSVAINDSGSAIIGGGDNSIPYAALVSPTGVTTALSGPALPIGTGSIQSVAINDSGSAIIGGTDDSILPNAPYAALVSPSGVRTPLSGPATPILGGQITSVAVNNSGAAIIGGQDNGNTLYAAFVSPTGVTSTIAPIPGGTGLISSVAINTSGSAIIGGVDGFPFIPYAALVSPTGATQVVGNLLPTGFINSVAINDSGAAIIGGGDGVSLAYAAVVSPSGVATSITGPGVPTGVGYIATVAINASGSAVIGGQHVNSSDPYVALVSPTGVATALTGPGLPVGIGRISSVAIADQIDPKSFGSGNTFANSLFALSTNVLDNHLKRPQERELELLNGDGMAGLTADARDVIRPTSSCQEVSPKYALWAAPFGLYAHQKKGNTFPGIRNRSVGGMIGFDYLGWERVILGAGGAYAYQDVGYSNNFGKARVNQEFLTLFGSWHQKYIAIQGALWGGLYQMDNSRKTVGIITSTSHVNGWIFSPHLKISTPFNPKDKRVTIEPFVMFDWVNNWQGSIKESGKAGFNLRMGRHYVSLLRSEVGLYLIESFQLKSGDLTFEESFSYVNNTPFNAKRVPAYYVGSISTFNLQMFNDRTINLGALRLRGRFVPCSLRFPYVYLTYLGEFGSKLISHSLALEVGKRF